MAVFVTIMLSLNSSCKVFKPDKTNGIEIQTELEAKLERERREKEAALQAPPPMPGSRNRYNKYYYCQSFFFVLSWALLFKR